MTFKQRYINGFFLSKEEVFQLCDLYRTFEKKHSFSSNAGRIDRLILSLERYEQRNFFVSDTRKLTQQKIDSFLNDKSDISQSEKEELIDSMEEN